MRNAQSDGKNDAHSASDEETENIDELMLRNVYLWGKVTVERNASERNAYACNGIE